MDRVRYRARSARWAGDAAAADAVRAGNLVFVGGRIPDDPARLAELPGIGRYTAGAVATFAYERRTPAVDTNVARVLRRAFHPHSAGARGERRLWDTAAALLPRRRADAWAFNQGIMELGALVCTARVARCEGCPVRRECATGARRRPA